MISNETLQRLRRGDKLKEVKLVIESSVGFQRWIELWESRMSYLIFLENNRSFKLNIKHLNSPDLFFMTDEIRWRKQRKLVKDLHNTISSSLSFKDHLSFRNRYNNGSEENNISRFFKFLRNFLIHVDTFPLISKMEWNNTPAIKCYQAMEKRKFLTYLDLRLKDNYKSDNPQATKERKGIERSLDYVNSLPETFNFEQIYKEYVTYIVRFHHGWVKNKVKGGLKELIELSVQIEEYENQVLDHYKLSIASLKDGEQYLKENISILTVFQRRYLRIVTNKKSWNKAKL